MEAIVEDRTKIGIPAIDVYVYSSWCARSYGTNDKAYSGTAAIIGRRTGQVLYIGIKKKKNDWYALELSTKICHQRNTNVSKIMKILQAPWKQIIVEGFKGLIPMYGIIYERIIEDGNASTYAAILKARPYRREREKD